MPQLTPEEMEEFNNRGEEDLSKDYILISLEGEEVGMGSINMDIEKYLKGGKK